MKKPIHVIRHGPVSAAVWENHTESGTFLSVTFSRTYQKGGVFQQSNSYSGANLIELLRAVAEAIAFVDGRRSKCRKDPAATELLTKSRGV